MYDDLPAVSDRTDPLSVDSALDFLLTDQPTAHDWYQPAEGPVSDCGEERQASNSWPASRQQASRPVSPPGATIESAGAARSGLEPVPELAVRVSLSHLPPLPHQDLHRTTLVSGSGPGSCPRVHALPMQEGQRCPMESDQSSVLPGRSSIASDSLGCTSQHPSAMTDSLATDSSSTDSQCTAWPETTDGSCPTAAVPRPTIQTGVPSVTTSVLSAGRAPTKRTVRSAEERNARRMAKNRATAAASRKRKQALQADLLYKQQTLERENGRLLNLLGSRESEIATLRSRLAMVEMVSARRPEHKQHHHAPTAG